MKTKRLIFLLLMVLMVSLLQACSSKGTRIEMELSQNYSNTDPFIHAKLFYVSKNTEKLKLDFTFQMEGESGLLEIADNNSGEVIWSDDWNGKVDKKEFSVVLDKAEQEKEYKIQFTGTGIIQAKIVMTSDSSLVKERERPLKPKKN